MPEKRKTELQTWNRNSLNKYKIVKIVVAILALIAVVEAVYIFYPSAIVIDVTTLSIPDISLNGFVKVDKVVPSIDPSTGQGSLSLRSGCYELAAGVELDMAQSISDGLQGVVGPRPNAHDIIKDVFQALKIDVLMAKVTERHDNLFFAKLLLRQGNTILNFDARPSDAIAIALRTNASIYINETLIRTEGKNVC